MDSSTIDNEDLSKQDSELDCANKLSGEKSENILNCVDSAESMAVNKVTNLQDNIVRQEIVYKSSIRREIQPSEERDKIRVIFDLEANKVVCEDAGLEWFSDDSDDEDETDVRAEEDEISDDDSTCDGEDTQLIRQTRENTLLNSQNLTMAFLSGDAVGILGSDAHGQLTQVVVLCSSEDDDDDIINKISDTQDHVQKEKEVKECSQQHELSDDGKNMTNNESQDTEIKANSLNAEHLVENDDQLISNVPDENPPSSNLPSKQIVPLPNQPSDQATYKRALPPKRPPPLKQALEAKRLSVSSDITPVPLNPPISSDLDSSLSEQQEFSNSADTPIPKPRKSRSNTKSSSDLTDSESLQSLPDDVMKTKNILNGSQYKKPKRPPALPVMPIPCHPPPWKLKENFKSATSITSSQSSISKGKPDKKSISPIPKRKNMKSSDVSGSNPDIPKAKSSGKALKHAFAGLKKKLSKSSLLPSSGSGMYSMEDQIDGSTNQGRSGEVAYNDGDDTSFDISEGILQEKVPSIGSHTSLSSENDNETLAPPPPRTPPVSSTPMKSSLPVKSDVMKSSLPVKSDVMTSSLPVKSDVMTSSLPVKSDEMTSSPVTPLVPPPRPSSTPRKSLVTSLSMDSCKSVSIDAQKVSRTVSLKIPPPRPSAPPISPKPMGREDKYGNPLCNNQNSKSFLTILADTKLSDIYPFLQLFDDRVSQLSAIQKSIQNGKSPSCQQIWQDICRETLKAFSTTWYQRMIASTNQAKLDLKKINITNKSVLQDSCHNVTNWDSLKVIICPETRKSYMVIKWNEQLINDTIFPPAVSLYTLLTNDSVSSTSCDTLCSSLPDQHHIVCPVEQLLSLAEILSDIQSNSLHWSLVISLSIFLSLRRLLNLSINPDLIDLSPSGILLIISSSDIRIVFRKLSTANEIDQKSAAQISSSTEQNYKNLISMFPTLKLSSQLYSSVMKQVTEIKSDLDGLIAQCAERLKSIIMTTDVYGALCGIPEVFFIPTLLSSIGSTTDLIAVIFVELLKCTKAEISNL